jgi:hypothetical protein
MRLLFVSARLEVYFGDRAKKFQRLTSVSSLKHLGQSDSIAPENSALSTILEDVRPRARTNEFRLPLASAGWPSTLNGAASKAEGATYHAQVELAR